MGRTESQDGKKKTSCSQASHFACMGVSLTIEYFCLVLGTECGLKLGISTARVFAFPPLLKEFEGQLRGQG
jgi:hypothetical protein